MPAPGKQEYLDKTRGHILNTEESSLMDEQEIHRRHYEVEKELAARLIAATREQRPNIYRTMYQELFERVPEHSRLAERMSPADIEIGLERQIRMVAPYLSSDIDLLEFAPGTSRFAYRVAKKVRSVMAADISDQRTGDVIPPDNFRHIIYDGYHLDLPEESSDIVFSNQFIEHIHPDDVLLHFQLAFRMLRPGGRYIFSTPHLYMGPWDVSEGFSDIAEGFHLKEWTCRELQNVLHNAGFRKTDILIWVKGKPVTVPMQWLYLVLEDIVGKFGRTIRRKLSRYLFTQILFTAVK